MRRTLLIFMSAMCVFSGCRKVEEEYTTVDEMTTEEKITDAVNTIKNIIEKDTGSLKGAQAEITAEDGYELYESEIFGYTMIYPENFKIVWEPENGDGIELRDEYNTELSIWGGVNIMEYDGHAALAKYIPSEEEIEYSYSNDNFWCYTFVDEDDRIQYRAGFINEEYEAGFLICYYPDYRSEYDELIYEMVEYMQNGEVFQ